MITKMLILLLWQRHLVSFQDQSVLSKCRACRVRILGPMLDRAESSCRASCVTDKQVLAAVEDDGLGQAGARGARELLGN